MEFSSDAAQSRRAVDARSFRFARACASLLFMLLAMAWSGLAQAQSCDFVAIGATSQLGPAGSTARGVSAETVLAVVEAQLAAALLRQRRDVEQDPATWRSLVRTGAEVRREQARLAAVSDRSSDVLQQARRKLDAIDRAVAHLVEEGLAPGPVTAWRGPPD